MNTFKKNIAALIFGCILAWFIFELLCFAFVKLGTLNIATPSYNLSNTRIFWQDTSFGLWHIPNHSYHDTKPCYQVVYKSNSYGSVDKERKMKTDSNRVVVLGDSFIEGSGVYAQNRLSNLLEESTKIPHLNFGAINSGTTQYYTIYQKLAKKFSHNTILIGLLPSNDLADDDIILGKKLFPNRYKPYWIGTYPEYSLQYYPNDLNKSELNNSKQNVIKLLLKNFTYSYNVLTYIKYVHFKKIEPSQKINNFSHENYGYFNFNLEQFNRVKYSLEQIKQIANDKNIMLVCIPSKNDLTHYKQTSKEIPPLSKDLGDFCTLNDIEFIDLLPYFYEHSQNNWNDLYLNCDGHWSTTGHELAAKILLQESSLYKQKPKRKTKNDINTLQESKLPL